MPGRGRLGLSHRRGSVEVLGGGGGGSEGGGGVPQGLEGTKCQRSTVDRMQNENKVTSVRI